MCMCYFCSLVVLCPCVELITIHELKRGLDAQRTACGPVAQDRPVRLASMGKHTLTNTILPFHVIPRAFTTALSRDLGDNNDRHLCAPRDSGVGDPWLYPTTNYPHARPSGLCSLRCLNHPNRYVARVIEGFKARLWAFLC